MAPSKKAKHAVDLGAAKKSGIENDPQSYYGSNPIFSFVKYDANAPWAVSSNEKPVTDSVFNNLRGKESMTWNGIMQESGGRGHGTNNHYVSIENLSKDARRRIADIGLNEDELFSIRLQGDVRLWGVIEPEDGNGKFYVIWFDPEHKVYPIRRN
jgi:hypothetical protein